MSQNDSVRIMRISVSVLIPHRLYGCKSNTVYLSSTGTSYNPKPRLHQHRQLSHDPPPHPTPTPPHPSLSHSPLKHHHHHGLHNRIPPPLPRVQTPHLLPPRRHHRRPRLRRRHLPLGSPHPGPRRHPL